MTWEKIDNKTWKAQGKDGVFMIERGSGMFWARYASDKKCFKMPPKKKLSEAKAMCEENQYWEEAEK